MQKKPLIVNGAFGIAFNSKGQALLTQRYQPEYPDVHLKWQIPGGGQEFGETLEQTLRREMKEEVGLTNLTILDPRPIVDMSVWNHEGEAPTQVNLFMYVVDIGSQEPYINDEESNALAWVDIEKVTSLPSFPGLGEFVSKAYTIYQNLKKKG